MNLVSDNVRMHVNLPCPVHNPFDFNISVTRNRGITLFCRLYSKRFDLSAMKEGVQPTTLIKNSTFLRNISRDMPMKVGAFLTAEENSDSDHPKLLMSSTLASNLSLLTLWRILTVHMNIRDCRGIPSSSALATKPRRDSGFCEINCG
ncbi:unnamed protein product [Musa acuminata subsp. burmannicoides]